ncbi:hypothetical protein D9613_009758 [Agrocybe pediades]|uniref:Uncharacterized protein n=1 Tax=Agrocybe pediades TaxID=84607 RepID=A0A8H4QX46_9AGAR|nr:hypothetical protein D9613_009758 [Agrocybe pediades]
MPVTFKVAAHEANTVKSTYRSIKTADDLLAATWGAKAKVGSQEVLQSSLDVKPEPDFSRIAAKSNGFVNTVVDAYNGHYRLILRPDDVWIAILGQFNFYVNAHAEELRSHFVAHEGKKELIVNAAGTRYEVDFGSLAQQMTDKIHDNVVDKDLKDWILPDFSTTTESDTVTCAVMMMATLKAYFDYTFNLMTCGIPSVTLEGERSDWMKLLERVDKLDMFGKEPTTWASLLRPILCRFVAAFDGEPDIDFWGKVCHHHSMGSGQTYLSGWITAFCVWSNDGKWLKRPFGLNSGNLELQLDGVGYRCIDFQDVPTEFCEVDVKLLEDGKEFDCMMVSGHLARLTTGNDMDTVRPMPCWFMFEKGSVSTSTYRPKKKMGGMIRTQVM